MLDSISASQSRPTFYYGSDAYDYTRDITSNTLLNAKANNTSNLNLFKKISGFTGSANLEIYKNEKYKFSSKYSVAHTTQVIKIMTYKLSAYPNDLTKYVTDDFNRDVSRWCGDKTQARKMVETYGTHALLDLTIGGRLTASFYSSYLEEDTYSKKRSQVKAGLNVALKAIKLESDVSVENIDIVTENKKNTVQRLQVITDGGSKPISETYDLLNGTPTKLNKEAWENSVYENRKKNAAIVDVNWAKAYPIYDFVEDPIKKEILKQAVVEYIQASQIKVLKLRQLHRLHSNKAGNTFWVFNKGEAEAIKDQYGDSYSGIDGYVLVEPEPNTKALHGLHSHKSGNRFYVFSEAEAREIARKYGDSYLGIHGYIYSSEQTNTRPLHRLHSNKAGNTYYLFTLNDAMYNKNKYGDSYSGIDGYIINP